MTSDDERPTACACEEERIEGVPCTACAIAGFTTSASTADDPVEADELDDRWPVERTVLVNGIEHSAQFYSDRVELDDPIIVDVPVDQTEFDALAFDIDSFEVEIDGMGFDAFVGWE